MGTWSVVPASKGCKQCPPLSEGQCMGCLPAAHAGRDIRSGGAHQHKVLSTHDLLEHMAEHLAGRCSCRETQL